MNRVTESMIMEMNPYTFQVMIISIIADTSDFEPNEIRTLAPKNPVPFKDIKDWDRILEAKKPCLGTYGINKYHDVFCFVNEEWRSIKQ